MNALQGNVKNIFHCNEKHSNAVALIMNNLFCVCKYWTHLGQCKVIHDPWFLVSNSMLSFFYSMVWGIWQQFFEWNQNFYGFCLCDRQCCDACNTFMCEVNDLNKLLSSE